MNSTRPSGKMGRWLAVLAAVCLLRAEEQPFQTESTRRMAERLERLAQEAEADPLNNAFLNEERAEHFRRQLEAASVEPEPSPFRLVNRRAEYGLELLQAGDSLEAISQLSQAFELHQGGAHFRGVRDPAALRHYLALAWLRLGEQENCLANHTAASCIIPLDPSAVHRRKRGSRQATRLLLEQLAENPNDLKARWLLNLAFMTLGEYPSKVPPRFLIPPSAFASEYDLGRFREVAGPLGLDVAELAGGCIADDFDQDGDLDLVVSSVGLRDQIRYFRNNGEGSFTDRTAQSGLWGEVGGLNIQQTDFDNDGFPDIFILRGGWFGEAGLHPKSLLRNRGDGTFEDVTEAAGLLSFAPTQTAVWFDFDGDGWLDVFIGHESRGGPFHPCQLFRNQRDGTFSECAAASGLAVTGWVKGVASADYNHDGRPDLYLSRKGEPNLLFRNDGPDPAAPATARWRFTDVTAHAGVAEPKDSFPTWFFDFDNDGWEDLFAGGFGLSDLGSAAADVLGLPHNAERPRLYRNLGDGTFTNVTRAMGLDRLLLAMGANFGDLDNDGWLDFYLGTGEPDLAALLPNRMFRNDAGRRFQDVTTSGGFGHLQKGHGIAFADFDHDGDQDIYEVIGGAFSGDTYRNVLFENPGHGNDWVKIKLEGVRANRPGVGAQLTFHLAAASNSGQTVERVIHRTLNTGGSFGASPLRLEVGLGRAERIERLDILWPGSLTRQTFTNLPARVLLTLRESDPQPRVTRLTPMPFRLPASSPGR